MITHVLEYLMTDAGHEAEKEFVSPGAAYVWLLGQRETDFEWMTLVDAEGNLLADGWSDIMSYLHPAKSSCNALSEPEHSMAGSEWVIDPFDTYGPDELPPVDLPKVERFSDLPDGTVFYHAQTYAYGGRRKIQKTIEDGGPHNAVLIEDTNIGITVRANQLVIRA